MTRVSDSFNRADGALGNADTGQAWTNRSGSHVISSNKAVYATGSDITSSTVDAAIADIDIYADLTATVTPDNTFFGFTIRFIDTVNLLYLLIVDISTFNGVFLGKRVAGVDAALASSTTPIIPGSTYTLRGVVDQSSIKVYLNGVPDFSYTLTGPEFALFGASTLHGLATLFATPSTFDNFAIDNANPQGFWMSS